MHYTPSRHTVVELLSAPAAGSRLGDAANYNGMTRHGIKYTAWDSALTREHLGQTELRDEVEVVGAGNGLHAAGDAELAVDVGDVPLDGAEGDD